MNINMLNVFITLTIAVIISQAVHTWYVFNAFSVIENKALKIMQGVLFCSILSVAILAFVLLGKHELALFGAIIEMIINVYYYSKDFWEKGYKSFTGSAKTKKQKRQASTGKFYRQNWMGILFGIILPFFIYIFSLIISELL